MLHHCRVRERTSRPVDMRFGMNTSRASWRRPLCGATSLVALVTVALAAVAPAAVTPAAVAPTTSAAVQTASGTAPGGVLFWPGDDSFKAGSLLVDRMAS